MAEVAIPSLRRCVDSVQMGFPEQLREVVAKNWHLGFTAFGGPPVHFQIVRSDAASIIVMNLLANSLKLHKKFVTKNEWVDEQLVSFGFGFNSMRFSLTEE